VSGESPSEPGGPEDEEPYVAPPHQLAVWSVLGAAFLVAIALFSIRGSFAPHSSRPYPSRVLPAEPVPVLLAAPEVDEEYLPCKDCHGRRDLPNREVRELEIEHDEMDFSHGDLWCYSCHSRNPEQRQSLELANGSRVEFEDAWRLCTQCHGKKLADWRAGVHGKRTGHWWGEKEYRPCTACHDPHRPPFEPIEPRPAPRRPESIALGTGAAEEAGS